MPQNISLTMLVLGGVLLLLALSSGGFKIFGAEMSGTTGRWSRLAAGLLGAGLIAAVIMKSQDQQPAAAASSDTGREAVAATIGNGTSKTDAVTPPSAAPVPPENTGREASAATSGNGTSKTDAVAPPPPEPISVECAPQSQGQHCIGSADLAGPFPDFLTLRATGGCSSIIYTVKFLHQGNGFALEEISAITTQPLAPNKAQTLRVPSGASVARISAEGVEGGCNTGRLASWNVLATR